MSKSKNNVISPEPLIRHYGADTVRVYTLFIGPPEKDAEWSERGVEGAYRFLNRAWRLLRAHGGLVASATAHSKPAAFSDEARLLRNTTHSTITRVTRDFESFHFNTAVAALMELTNTLLQVTQNNAEEFAAGAAPDLRWAVGEGERTLILLLGPLAPHLAEEMWATHGGDEAGESIFRIPWPTADPEALRVETETIVVQVNGKVRAQMEIAVSLAKDEIEELARSHERVKQFLDGKKVHKVIHVPHRLVNMVVK